MRAPVRTSHLWLPFTQMRCFDPSSRTFVHGEGTSLVDSRGRRVFDAVSSIWTIVHGHCHPRIAHAIARQASELDHATLLGATNPVAEELAERLSALTGMDRVFFASDGASAVEAAIKIALQYWRNRREPQRTRFVRLAGAYHGDTTGAMSLSGIELFKERFGAITFETRAFDAAHVWAGDVAAVIVEPLVQAAAGLRIVPAHTYAQLADIEPLLIVDEIATGFGRTGTMFAVEQLGLSPDLLCLGKSITGGSLALSATLATSRVFEAFDGAYGDFVHFFHGHSYAGNPIACAAALASLELFDEENTLANAAAIARRIEERLSRLSEHELVREARQAGTMTGIEIAADRLEAYDAPTPAWQIASGLYERGHFTRPIGDTIQFVPPLSSDPVEIDAFFDAFEAEIAR
ncbi:MAG: aminotransferase class III-fold pyridoxal phosphate-dependent enzyme [Candidatus Eremiobacteraeota bacterium]|nr:aminotransferase class III-fold pyridoxal phosphate-dependent enzyme [Candidatus Eremiobacteraeota bacterium]